MKLLVSALEHSANVHLKSLLEYLPVDVELMGIFSQELGMPIVDLQSSAIMGFVDAIKKVRFYSKLSKQMTTLAKDADKVLLIDSSGFNLPLAKKIKRAYPDKEIIYYILPQAWAWKKGRIKVLERNVDKMASILPFEQELYSKDAQITYVGHPLLDSIKRYKKGVSKTIRKIAFMPGSRRSEIQKLMPIFRELSHKLDARSILIIPEHLDTKEVKKLYGNLDGFKIEYNTHKTLLEVDFAFICSGTATLEASLIGTPFVLSYIAKPMDYVIAKKFINPEYIGLGNILLKRYNNAVLHPELIQNDVTVQNLIGTMKSMNRELFYQNSLNLVQYLEQGSAQETANIIIRG